MGSWFQRGRTRLAAWIKKNILRPIKLVRKHPQKIEAANGRAVSFPPVIRQTAIGGRIGGQAIVENCTTSALTTSLRSLRPDDGWSPKQVIRQLNRLLLDVQNGRVTEQELHSIARAGWDLDTSQRILEHLRANRISSKDGKAMLIPGDLGIALSRPGMSLFLARQGIPNRWLGLRNRSEVQETLQHLHAGKPVILGDTRRRHVVTLLGHPDKHQEIWCMDSLLGTWAKYDPSQLNFSQHEGAIMALLAG